MSELKASIEDLEKILKEKKHDINYQYLCEKIKKELKNRKDKLKTSLILLNNNKK
jgi:hypothetical protein